MGGSSEVESYYFVAPPNKFRFLAGGEHSVFPEHDECWCIYALPFPPPRLRYRVDCRDHHVRIKPWPQAVAALFKISQPRLFEWAGAKMRAGHLMIGEGHGPRTKEITHSLVLDGRATTGAGFQQDQPEDKIWPRCRDEHRCVPAHGLPDKRHRSTHDSLDDVNDIVNEGLP